MVSVDVKHHVYLLTVGTKMWLTRRLLPLDVNLSMPWESEVVSIKTITGVSLLLCRA